MIKDTKFHWHPEDGVAVCVLTNEQGKVFVGEAFCHPDDLDMLSERTGCEIAFRRARIEYLRATRDNEIKPALRSLKQLYYSMKLSSQFNPNSYENIMLQRHIRSLEFDLTTIKEILVDELQRLREYIKGKDKVYQKIRLKNSQAENN